MEADRAAVSEISEMQQRCHHNNNKPAALMRFFSIEAESNSHVVNCYEQKIQQEQAEGDSLGNREFVLKLLQLLVGIISAGLYSEGVKAMPDSINSLMFPNVVFSAFIIITSVIAMGYVLGHPMAPILVRIFNTIGVILYFVSACVTWHAWFSHSRHLRDPEKDIPVRMLLAQVSTSALNFALYGLDVYFSVKKALLGA